MSVARTETIFSCGQAPRTPCPEPPAIAASIVPCHSGSTSAPVPPSSAVAETSPGVVSGVALTPLSTRHSAFAAAGGARCVGEEHGVGGRRLAGDDRRRGAGDARGQREHQGGERRDGAGECACGRCGWWWWASADPRPSDRGGCSEKGLCRRCDGAEGVAAADDPLGGLGPLPLVGQREPPGRCDAHGGADGLPAAAVARLDDDERPRRAERRDPEAAGEAQPGAAQRADAQRQRRLDAWLIVTPPSGVGGLRAVDDRQLA